MKGNRLVWASSTMALTLALSASAFAQTQPVQTRIPQQVIINGQKVNGAYVATASGGMQAYTCSNPQPYVTPDNASQGWACYDQATGVWLLNAVPPSTQAAQPAPAPAPAPQAPAPQAPAPMGAPLPGQPPAVVYQQPPTVIYQQPYPAVVYAAPAPVVVAPAYPPGVVLGAAAINATGRIVSAALLGPRFGGFYYYGRGFRRW